MKRTAQCSCGELQITLEGDPDLRIACNCTNCQRRTGSAFGFVAYYGAESVVSRSGDGRQFTQLSDGQRKIDRTFCPACGSTVHWEAELFPGMVGVAAGCFTDPDFPGPNLVAWHNSKMQWTEFPRHLPHLAEQDPAQAIEGDHREDVAA